MSPNSQSRGFGGPPLEAKGMRESRFAWASFARVLLFVTIVLLPPRGGAAPASSPADLDEVYGIKGWNVRYSFGDTITQDHGGWRSRLASAGMGLIEYNITRFQDNVLDT